MKHVRIPSTLKVVEANTFVECRNLESVQLPEALVKIGVGAFSKSGIRDVVLPKSTRVIGACAFLECEDLRSIQLNEGLEKLGEKERFYG